MFIIFILFIELIILENTLDIFWGSRVYTEYTV
jgi:hypothetical protein